MIDLLVRMASATGSSVTLVTAVDVTTWNAILVESSSQESGQSTPDAAGYEELHVWPAT